MGVLGASWAPSAHRFAHASFATGAPSSGGRGTGLEELERLHVEQAARLGDDLGVAQRLQELDRRVEVAHPDAHRAEALSDVRVRAGAGWDAVLGGKARGLLVEGADRDTRVEDLYGVDIVDDV